ncbi:MAG TPA: HAMP domain-containing sensor histidine kinase [Gemmatimonadales bacterium]|jgi:signal transduction histidine kinase|nr:HAMP domain-containing sensor histidine kinase [Gemmatimonadales bacterium]
MNRPTPAPGTARERSSDPAIGVAPVTGINSRLLTRAIRRVEARWREQYGPSTQGADIPRILAASALAADRGDASFIDSLTPRPSLRLSLHLVDLLEDELLALARAGESTASQVLQIVGRLRVVRAAIEGRFQQLPGAPLVGIDGLEFLIEFVHDMRSPLTSLLLLADRLQQGWSGPLTPLQLRQLRLIYAAAHALNTVTSNALQMARERDQLEEPEARPFSVTKLLSEVQEVVRTLADQKGLEVNFIRPNVDRRLGHPVELQRILLNLVTNALKFTRAGTITVRATDRDGDQLEFAVQDTGPGIHSTAQETLYQPFRRPSASRGAVFSATGLGLAITQRLVAALGGQLKYNTAPGKGTLFFFTLDLPVA